MCEDMKLKKEIVENIQCNQDTSQYRLGKNKRQWEENMGLNQVAIKQDTKFGGFCGV